MIEEATTVHYYPQDKQQIALSRSEDLLFYGGAKGGGKSDYLLVDWMDHANKYAENARGIIFRKTYNELEELIYRAKALYGNASFSESTKIWHFDNGAELKMRYVESDADVSRYQGHQYTWIGFDELTEWATQFCFIFMISCLRSPQGTPCFIRASGNPGRIGHLWVKDFFIDVAPPMVPYKRVINLPGNKIYVMWQIFIPATLEDNQELMKNDPGYEARLALLPPHLYKAFRYGDWDVFAGAAFEELNRENHCIDTLNPPHRLLDLFDFQNMTPKKPNEIKVFRAMDWGYAKPFSVGWYFADYDSRLYRFKEMYGAKGINEGIQMPAREVARKIKEIEKENGWKIALSVADASIWDKPGNQNEKAEKLPSIAETMGDEGVWFDREVSIAAKKSRIQGKHQLHERLRIDADGLPHLFVFSTCVNWWRTVPVIPLDQLNPEDVDTDTEDHCYDETRYMLSSRPMKARVQPVTPPKMSLDWIQKHYMRPLNG